ncbi:MAG: H4MPT-linked C1 transfer pathway protein [Planctomycetes bacterium]|nr:H4MPT-linked C1 transfer pathway protein [Planctomycetota bacterium]
MRPADDLLALDIGGANLKAADGRGWSHAVPFPLWKRWRELPAALTALIAEAGPRRVVATMTGEICDCYASRAVGVAHIARALTAAAATCREPAGIYLVDGRIVTPSEAVADWRLAAASNWHALARLAASLTAGDRAFLVDVGSTTTDIVPLEDGRPAPRASDDAGRMLAGELVYTGMERTAVAAITPCLPHRGVWRPVASEAFAESRDAWLVLGALAEDPAAHDTADGAPAIREAARVRLARTMLLDPADFTAADVVEAAAWIAARQATRIARALRRTARGAGGPPQTVVLSGHGDELALRALAAADWRPTILHLGSHLGASVARAAPAHALACIARKELA